MILSADIATFLRVALVAASLSLLAGRANAQRIGVSSPNGNRSITMPSVTQSQDPDCKRSRDDILGQLAVGVLGAWIGGVVFHGVISAVDSRGRRVKGDAGYTPNANTAFAIGSWLGSTALVFVAGRSACGSLGRTAIGTAVPSALLLLGRHEPWLPVIGAFAVAPLQALGGTLMFPKR